MAIDREPERVYAVGDVHGCLDKLRRLEASIVADASGIAGEKIIVHLGDYIDRGPDSARVIDHLLSPAPEGFRRICLCGNHEALLLQALDDPETTAGWLAIGGVRTLESYGYDLEHMADAFRIGRIEAARRVLARLPAPHVAFLRALPVSFTTPARLFVHAGVRPGIALEQQSDHDLLWTRFLSAEPAGRSLLAGRCVVHGHTVTAMPFASNERVCVDTGAYRGSPLTAACFDGGPVRFLQAH
ncbi:MAG: serine/threonine protein phosphatase [Rhizobiaceae bacterium]|nr:serine/threonine protein phosphatase [Rhizobiaceae bacterium]